MRAKDCLRALFIFSLLVCAATGTAAATPMPNEKATEGGSGTFDEAALTLGDVEVNDKFILINRKKGDISSLEFVILDGIRKSYPGDCKSLGPVPGMGVPRETRVIFEYGPISASNEINFSISRTLDFNGHMRTYQFSAKKGEVLTLDTGVLVSLDSAGMLSYEQVVQPIGPAGRKAVSLRFDTMNDALSSAVVDLDADRWSFEPNGKVNGIPISSARTAGGGAFDITPIRNDGFNSGSEVRLRSMLANAETSGKVSTIDIARIYCFMKNCWNAGYQGYDTCREIASFCECEPRNLRDLIPYGWIGWCRGFY